MLATAASQLKGSGKLIVNNLNHKRRIKKIFFKLKHLNHQPQSLQILIWRIIQTLFRRGLMTAGDLSK